MSVQRPAIHSRDHWADGPDPALEHWSFVEPVSPATEDDSGGVAAADFQGAWINIGDPHVPTAFRLAHGDLQLRIAATGDETTPGSVIFTLPDTHIPPATRRLFIVIGDDGIGIVDVMGANDSSPGDVVFIGRVSA